MASEIKVNNKGISHLLLNYPLELRLRAKRMAHATGLAEQELIRRGIEQIVSVWEAASEPRSETAIDTEQLAKKTRKTRKPRQAETLTEDIIEQPAQPKRTRKTRKEGAQ